MNQRFFSRFSSSILTCNDRPDEKGGKAALDSTPKNFKHHEQKKTHLELAQRSFFNPAFKGNYKELCPSNGFCPLSTMCPFLQGADRLWLVKLDACRWLTFWLLQPNTLLTGLFVFWSPAKSLTFRGLNGKTGGTGREFRSRGVF